LEPVLIVEGVLDEHLTLGYPTPEALEKRIKEKAFMLMKNHEAFEWSAILQAKPLTDKLRAAGVGEPDVDGLYHLVRRQCFPGWARREGCPFSIRWKLAYLRFRLARFAKRFRSGRDDGPHRNGQGSGVPKPLGFFNRLATAAEEFLRTTEGTLPLPQFQESAGHQDPPGTTWQVPWVAVDLRACCRREANPAKNASKTIVQVIVHYFNETCVVGASDTDDQQKNQSTAGGRMNS
jgi:hypothetical protein